MKIHVLGVLEQTTTKKTLVPPSIILLLLFKAFLFRIVFRLFLIIFVWRYLSRDHGTLVERNENQLCDYMTTEPILLEIFHVITLAEYEPSEKHAHCFQSLCKNSSFGPYPFYRDKRHLGRASQPRSCNLISPYTVHCIVTQFARESFGNFGKW